MNFDFDDTPRPPDRSRGRSARQQLIRSLQQLAPHKCLRVEAPHLTTRILGQMVRAQAFRMHIKVTIRADGAHAVRVWRAGEGGQSHESASTP